MPVSGKGLKGTARRLLLFYSFTSANRHLSGRLSGAIRPLSDRFRQGSDPSTVWHSARLHGSATRSGYFAAPAQETKATRYFQGVGEVKMNESNWKDFFSQWLPETARRGVLITTYGEQVPFAGFLTSDEFLLVERQTPDTSGARAVILPYSGVAAVKFTDVLKERSLHAAGFQGMLPKK